MEAVACWTLTRCMRDGVADLPMREGRTGLGEEKLGFFTVAVGLSLVVGFWTSVTWSV